MGDCGGSDGGYLTARLRVTMAAIVYGDINFGMAAESGLYVESVDFDTSVDTVFIGDEQGADVAGATFNPSASFTITGFTNTGGTMTAKTGESIVLANAIDWASVLSNGYTAGGQTIITGVKVGLNHKNAESKDVSGMFKPFLGATGV